MTILSAAALLLIPILAIGAGAYCLRKRLHIWLPGYTADSFRHAFSDDHRSRTTDIMFLTVDHFELAGKKDRLDAWMNRYPTLAGSHRDSDGFHPRHSWFYALDLMHEHEIEALSELVRADYGEIELHWHHDHDDADSFTRKLRAGMQIFHRHGHMLPHAAGRRASFGFIHGNWSLANSRGAEFCGVDNEIEVLLREGCYGDFTYPALFNDGQPSLTNCVYYAKDSGRPKSYNTGKRAALGRRPGDDELMIFQGPLHINWRDWRFGWHPTFEDGDIHRGATHGESVRIDSWINRAIHVKGKPEWIFAKTFCHGAQDHESVLGPSSHEMYEYLERTFNDGSRYRLHYVTAREAYNIVRAAEDGKSGNPGQYRDYEIGTPAARHEAAVAPPPRTARASD